MRKLFLWSSIALFLAAQLLMLDSPPRLSPALPDGRSPSGPDVALPASSTGGVSPIYRGKRWWGLCPAYAADSVSALYREYEASPRLQKALAGFDWGHGRLVTLDSPQMVHVAYAHQDGDVAWSSKQITLPEGEVMITDRVDPLDESNGHLVRTYCCNPVSIISRPPVRPSEPPIEELELWWHLEMKIEPPPAFLPPSTGSHTPGAPTVVGVIPSPPAIITFPPIMTLPPSIVVILPPHGHEEIPPHGGRHKHPPKPDHHGDRPPHPPEEQPYVPPGIHPESPPGPTPVPEASTGMLMLAGMVLLYFGRKWYARPI